MIRGPGNAGADADPPGTPARPEEEATAAVPRDRLPALSLFYPMHNEEGNVEEAVARALRILPRYADEFEVILVDDGSTDRTGALADALARRHPQVRAVHHPQNRGYGGALRSGIAACRHPWIFYTDGDNQFDLDELRLLLPFRHEHAVVTGYRIDRRDSLHRRGIGWIFNRLIRVLFGLALRDADCAFKLYDAAIFKGMELRAEGAMIDVEILVRARRRGARIREVGVHHYPRRTGEPSGANLSVILRAFRETLRLWGDLRP